MAEIDRQSGLVVTTDATPTTLVTIPLLAGQTAFLEVKLTNRTGDLDQGWYKMDRGIKRASTGGAIVGLAGSSAQEDAALTPTSFDVVASGNNALVQVTGIAATSISWAYDILITYT